MVLNLLQDGFCIEFSLTRCVRRDLCLKPWKELEPHSHGRGWNMILVRTGHVYVFLEVDVFTGPGKGGPQSPYFQSQRLDLYHSYAKKLLDVMHYPFSLVAVAKL